MFAQVFFLLASPQLSRSWKYYFSQLTQEFLLHGSVNYSEEIMSTLPKLLTPTSLLDSSRGLVLIDQASFYHHLI